MLINLKYFAKLCVKTCDFYFYSSVFLSILVLYIIVTKKQKGKSIKTTKKRPPKIKIKIKSKETENSSERENVRRIKSVCARKRVLERERKYPERVDNRHQHMRLVYWKSHRNYLCDWIQPPQLLSQNRLRHHRQNARQDELMDKMKCDWFHVPRLVVDVGDAVGHDDWMYLYWSLKWLPVWLVVLVWDMCCKMVYMDGDVRWLWLLLDLEDNSPVNGLRHLEYSVCVYMWVEIVLEGKINWLLSSNLHQLEIVFISLLNAFANRYKIYCFHIIYSRCNLQFRS